MSYALIKAFNRADITIYSMYLIRRRGCKKSCRICITVALQTGYVYVTEIGAK